MKRDGQKIAADFRVSAGIQLRRLDPGPAQAGRLPPRRRFLYAQARRGVTIRYEGDGFRMERWYTGEAQVPAQARLAGEEFTNTDIPNRYDVKVVLPSTGGRGVYPIYALGMLLMAGALYPALRMRRRREKRARQRTRFSAQTKGVASNVVLGQPLRSVSCNRASCVPPPHLFMDAGPLQNCSFCSGPVDGYLLWRMICSAMTLRGSGDRTVLSRE